MVQTANSLQATTLLNNRPDLKTYLRPFVSRRGTQRHCDHLEKLLPAKCNPNERKIECFEVALFLVATFSEKITHGFWEVDALSLDAPIWTPIVRCETFELLVQCPPGKRITLGDLDIVVILESCLEDAKDGPFIRRLTSTSKCWPTGHVNFKWMLRGTMAAPGTAPKSSASPAVQRQKSMKQLLTPVRWSQLAQSPEKSRTDTAQQMPPPALASPTTPSRIQRWKIMKQRSPPSVGGICATETPPREELRRNSLKERASSLFQPKWQARSSTSSVSTSSSWYSRGSISSNTEAP